MAEPARYDIAIVGASIAGCAAAIFFARNGARVALIERDPDLLAYKKLCTHTIQSSATPTLRRLGLTQALDEAGAIRHDAEFHTKWGVIQSATSADYGYNIRRSTLDPLMRRRAITTSGVGYFRGCSVRGLVETNGRVGGVTLVRHQGAEETVLARLVVGADGRNSTVAQLAGMPARAAPNGRIGYFAQYRNLPLPAGARSQMWFLEPDVACVFPSDDDVTVVTAMPSRDRIAEWKSDPEGALRRLFAGLPNAPRLDEGERVTPIMGVLEYPNLSRKAFKPGVALIGDAALCIDPVWAIGCGWALQSAEWLADAVGAAFEDEVEIDQRLALYGRRRRALSGHRCLINDFSSGRPFNLAERLMIAAAARDPACADHFVAFGSRSIGAAQFLRPSALARALWVNARHTLAPPRPAASAAGRTLN